MPRKYNHIEPHFGLVPCGMGDVSRSSPWLVAIGNIFLNMFLRQTKGKLHGKRLACQINAVCSGELHVINPCSA